ncbi:S-adenosyl-L-methionine-dependent methyltransferase [Phytophthora cactorum]|nr:S-adenosyl-L-methionine-dependent methyltransferase [Phytophthora cactorum]
MVRTAFSFDDDKQLVQLARAYEDAGSRICWNDVAHSMRRTGHPCGPEAAVEVSDAYACHPRVRLPCQFLLAGPQTSLPPPPPAIVRQLHALCGVPRLPRRAPCTAPARRTATTSGEIFSPWPLEATQLPDSAHRADVTQSRVSPQQPGSTRAPGSPQPITAAHAPEGLEPLSLDALEVAPQTSRASPLSPTSAERAVVEIFADFSRETVLGYDGRSIHHNVGEILPGGVSILLRELPIDERDKFVDIGAGLGNVIAQDRLRAHVEHCSWYSLVVPYLTSGSPHSTGTESRPTSPDTSPSPLDTLCR